MATEPEGLSGPSAPADRRLSGAQVGLAIVGVLLLLLVVWFLFLRGSDEPEEAAAPPPVAEEEGPSEEDAEPPNRKSPVETFEVFAPKDPFDPLISPASGGGAATGTGATTVGGTTTTTGGTTAGTTSGGTTTTTTTTTTGSNNSSSGEDIGGHRVRVIDVFVEGGSGRAQVQVDGTVYTVDEGERFAQNFQLLSTSGRCATMLFGDDEFTLCEGEEILK